MKVRDSGKSFTEEKVEMREEQKEIAKSLT